MTTKPERAEAVASAQTPSCATCGKPSVSAYRPFCSKRCADIDLARWLNGSYAVPAQDQDDGETTPELEQKRDARQP